MEGCVDSEGACDRGSNVKRQAREALLARLSRESDTRRSPAMFQELYKAIQDSLHLPTIDASTQTCETESTNSATSSKPDHEELVARNEQLQQEVGRMQDLVDSLRRKNSRMQREFALERDELWQKLNASPHDDTIDDRTESSVAESICESLSPQSPFLSGHGLESTTAKSHAQLMPSTASTVRRPKASRRHGSTEFLQRGRTSSEPSVKSAESIARDAAHEFKTARKLLTDTKAEWDDRVKCMASLVAISQHSDVGAIPNFWDDVDSLKKCMAVQIEDLRSSVVKVVCQLLVVWAEARGHSFESYVSFMLPRLLIRSYVTIKVISDASDSCIRSLIELSRPTKCIPKLVKGISDPHIIVRSRCLTYLTLLIPSCSTRELDAHCEIIASAIRSGIGDADNQVRMNARELFVKFQGKFPRIAEELCNELPQATQKRLTA